MKRTSLPSILLLLALVALGACSSTVWDELPQKITVFLSDYFPGQGVKIYVEGAESETVELTHSATIVFDKDYHWTMADGNGVTLPELFVTDQMPPALVQWLQEREMTDEVYKAERTSAVYILTLYDTYIEYNISTGDITYPEEKTP